MSCAPMAPGTALNDVGVAAVWASADGLIIRLPAATPRTTPTASADTIVIVLLIALLRASTTWQSCSSFELGVNAVADLAIEKYHMHPILQSDLRHREDRRELILDCIDTRGGFEHTD